MTTQFKTRQTIAFAIFCWLVSSQNTFAQLGWISSGQPSAWGNVYGVGVPSPVPGNLCNGNATVYYKYDDSGNRVLRTIDVTVLKTKKDGLDDPTVAPTVKKAVSEKALQEAVTAKVFPNPATDVLIVEQSQVIENSNYELYDSNGKQILTQKAELRTEISISHLPSGVYLLVMRSAGTTAQWKIDKI